MKYLKLVQIWCRVENRLKFSRRRYFSSCPPVREIHLFIPEIDCDETFVRRFKVDEMAVGKVCLLNQMVKLDYSYSYTHSLKPLIHNNVYYFEYGIVLAAKYKQTGDVGYVELFKKCYYDYLNTRASIISSYIMSLHIPNVLIALDMFGPSLDYGFKKSVYCELYSMYRYLERHQEKHLLANHYFENLKALTIASYLFGEDKKYNKYLRLLKEQAQGQILSDGVHYELSPMYHKLILEDLLRIASLDINGDWLKQTIQIMTSAMVSMEEGIGRTPLFNDAGDNVAKTSKSLLGACTRIMGVNPVTSVALTSAGYFKIYDANIAMMIDCGRIGVDYQPAHGHCDCLSFELSINGMPLFVNQGTYEYQGEDRNYFKRTSAHNTVMINGHEQSECWGEFRVGKRITSTSGLMNEQIFVGSCINYYGETHKRQIALKNKCLEVMDTISGSGQSYLHIAPNYSYLNGIITKGDETICRVEPINCSVSFITEGILCTYAQEFGKVEQCTCLMFCWDELQGPHGYKVLFE